jgi:hypothetical protein
MLVYMKILGSGCLHIATYRLQMHTPMYYSWNLFKLVRMMLRIPHFFRDHISLVYNFFDKLSMVRNKSNLYLSCQEIVVLD